MMDKLGDDGLVVDGRKLFFEYRFFPPLFPDHLPLKLLLSLMCMVLCYVFFVNILIIVHRCTCIIQY